MSYASLDELTARYGESFLVDLTDRGAPPGAIDESAVDRALADADALIDGYLKGRYALPLSVTPPLIIDLALKIAIYNLHRSAVADKIAADYAAALKTLAGIGSGLIRLDVAGAEPASSGATGVKTNDRCPDMTPCNLKGYI